MIKKLKIRFIVLAMVSLAVLLTVIVAGMNIVNYRKVVSDADNRLEVLEENSDRLLSDPGSGGPDGPGGPGSSKDGMQSDPGSVRPEDMDDDDDAGDSDDIDDIEDQNIENVKNLDDRDEFFGRDGRGGLSMSQDEAEESRFFTVTLSESCEVQESNTNRISSVDSGEAAEYAEQAIASGKEKGFIDDFRFDVSDDDDGSIVITFLDCGRVLDSFEDFLKYSVMMSVIGLLIMFAVITYFAGRIVRPVAESYEKQKRFITDAGHEIKTPLAIIKANIDVLNLDIDSGVENIRKLGSESKSSDGTVGSGQTAYIDPSGSLISEKAAYELRDSLGDINDQVDRLTGLTNDLVYLSRMEESGNTLVMTEVPLSDIVSETVSSFEPLALEKGKLIDMDIAPMITVKGSHKELEKLVSIIMENAVKYSAVPDPLPCGDDEEAVIPAAIRATLTKDGKNAVIEVSNGTENELTNESLSHVFERFYRTDSSRNSATGGHGIGLSMASAIVSAHGGKISARTSNGRDFIVTASIPVS